MRLAGIGLLLFLISVFLWPDQGYTGSRKLVSQDWLRVHEEKEEALQAKEIQLRQLREIQKESSESVSPESGSS